MQIVDLNEIPSQKGFVELRKLSCCYAVFSIVIALCNAPNLV